MVGSCLPCPSCSVPWEGMDCSPLKERSLSVGTNLGGASFDLDQFLCSVLQQDTWEMFPCSVLVFCFWFFWRYLLPLEIFCCKVVEFMNLPYTWCMVKFLSSRDCNLLYCLSASLSLGNTEQSLSGDIKFLSFYSLDMSSSSSVASGPTFLSIHFGYIPRVISWREWNTFFRWEQILLQSGHTSSILIQMIICLCI